MKSNYLTEILFAPQLQSGRVESISGFYCIATPVYSKPYRRNFNTMTMPNIKARAVHLSIDEYLLIRSMKHEQAYSTNLVQNKIMCYT